MRADDVLSDDTNQAEFSGMLVRKGTIAAFLMNAKTWSNAATDKKTRDQAEVDIREAIPALRAVGLFDVLAVKDPALAQLIAES